MKHVSQNSKIFLFAGLFIISIGASAWQFKGNRQVIRESAKETNYDTAGPAANHIDKIDLRLNFDSIMQAAQASIAAIDYNKIQQEVNASLASINFNEINKSIENALKSIDWDKMKTDVAASLDEVKASVATIDTKQLQQELAQIKIQLNSQQFKESINLKGLQQQLQQSMNAAKHGIAEAKKELDNYKALAAALQHDGLLKADQPFKVELKNDELYINDVKQTKQVTEKYRRFYSGKKDFSVFDNGADEDDQPDSTDL